MSAIAGIFNRDGGPIDRSILELMMTVRPERGPDGQQMKIMSRAGLAHQHFWITPEEQGEQQPLVSDNCLLCCDARLDNRQQLSRILGLDREQSAQQSDAALIMLSYQKLGVDCLTHLLGDFAFILWDAGKQQFFIARDALGARDICYYVDERVCLVASEVSQILVHPRIRRTLNDNRVAAFLAFLWDKPEESFYEGINFLPPAHGMTVSADRVSIWRYWDVNPGAEIRYQDEQDYADHYLELLNEAVRCRLRSVGHIAISLSGGLDSTSLAALAAPMLPQNNAGSMRLRSYSYVFNELHSCDEREFIEPVVAKYALQATYLPCDDKWPLKDLNQWPTSRDFVFADPYLWLPVAVMNAAQASNIRLLLGGYYGDTLFGGGRFWALDMLRGKRLGVLAKTVIDARSLINWQQDIFDNGLRQLLPAKVVRGYRRWRPRTVKEIAPAIHPDLVSRTNVEQRLSFSDQRSKFPIPGQWHRYNNLMLSVYSQGLSATRHLYNGYGIEPVGPYYDRRLVEFVMAVPAEELGRPDYDRRLHRRAMTGLLPEKVRLRRHFTVFTPLLLKGLQVEEKETVKRILTDPLVVQYKYIDGDWLRRQLAQDFVLSDESMRLWFVLCLELWLQRYWT